MAERFKNYGTSIARDFMKLPERAQELWFEYYEDCILRQHPEELIFLSIAGCDYSECKSPIEVIFNFAFDLLICHEGFPDISIEPQREIKSTSGKKYIADFVFIAEDSTMTQDSCLDFKLVIECDGHEFHEKTKEQVIRDNERNMELQEMGYDVIHFSGSQIYSDPIKCAKKLYCYIMKKIGYGEY